ncbi:MAG: alpha/beta hydrolase fold domain-containing protein, partial [Bacteroidales bacterium]
MQPTLKTLLLLAMCILSGHLPAQHHRMHPDIPADTSYNVQKELVKHRKKYPFIQIAEEVHSEGSTFLDNLTYHRIDQRDLHLDLFLPKQAGSTAAPLVIMIHGGGWRSGNKDMDHPMAAYWAANGYIAACVEYRLSMEAQYPAQIQEIKTAIRWLKLHAQRFAIDTTKVAIMGCSAGG